jgi:hypothetical protein
MRLIDDPVARAAAERRARTSLGLALRKDGALLGMITCSRGEVRPLAPRRSRSWKTSQRRRSLRWTVPGCSANCASAPASSRNRSNTRPRPARCSRSSVARLLIFSRSSTHWSRPGSGFAAPTPEGSQYARARSTAMWRKPRRLQRTPSIGRPRASEPLSPVAIASPGGSRSKAGSCMSRTSALIRTTRCPRATHHARSAAPARRRADRHYHAFSEAGRAVHRAADRLFQYRLKDRLELTRRGIDDLQYLGRRGLLLPATRAIRRAAARSPSR